jgi:tetratricopeptide (TPR) repeat protein
MNAYQGLAAIVVRDARPDGSAPASENDEGRSPGFRTVFNLRFFLCSLVVVVSVAAGGYFRHKLEVRRQAKEMLLCRAAELEEEATSERGDAARRKECFREAATCLNEYLQLAPGDAEARVRLAKAIDRSGPARPNRAIALYYDALGVATAEEAPGLRKRLAELLLDAGGPLVDMEEAVFRPVPYDAWFVRAEEEADDMLKESSDEAQSRQGMRIKALALYGQWLNRELVGQRRALSVVGETLLQALDRNPGDLRLSIVLAVVCREHPALLPERVTLPSGKQGKSSSLSQSEREQLANATIDRMVEHDRRVAEAHLGRYQYRIRYGVPGAVDDLRAALNCSPSDPTVLRCAARHSTAEAQRCASHAGQAAQHLQTAYRLYQRLMAVAPSEERAYLGLAETLNAQGRPEQAIETLRNGLRVGTGHHLLLRQMLVESLIQQGRLDASAHAHAAPGACDAETELRTLEAAIAMAGPDMTTDERCDWRCRVDLLHAKRHLAKREHDRVLVCLDTILGTRAGSDPADNPLPGALWLAGQAFRATGRWDLAVQHFEQAAVLRPQDARYRWASAEACEKTGRNREAILHYQRLVKDAPTLRAWLALIRARIERRWSVALKGVELCAQPRPKSQLLAAGRIGSAYVQWVWSAGSVVSELIDDWKNVRYENRLSRKSMRGQVYVDQP